MGFMTLEHSHRAELRLAREEGEARGEAQANALTKRLLEDGRVQDLERALDDEAYREALYEELGIH